MLIAFEDRLSDSPLIERVWRSRSRQAGRFQSIAACHWEIVVTRLEGKMSLTVRGPETVATEAELPGDGEWIAIRFKLGTYMPLFRPGFLRNLNTVTLPAAATRSCWLNGSSLEYPNYENAEYFVRRLVRLGAVVADPSIQATLDGRTDILSTRTAERRFQQVTGLTQGTIRQIERARRAALMLRNNRSILDAGFAAGYYDQAHLSRSLKRFIGQTPAEIIGARKQLSFLYNNEPA